MNELERLANENKANYLSYLKRMNESMKVSTKGLIPIMCSDKTNFLDVGCGSGVLMQAIEDNNPNAIITGLDLNSESIKKLEALGKKWHLYNMDFLKLPQETKPYDAIVFSSVLHEVSSYHTDLSKRFTSLPIEECFKKANELLDLDGLIIIRDGLLMDEDARNEQINISFKNPRDVLWLYKFQREFHGFDKLNDVDKSINILGPNLYQVGLTFLKEFLYTYTWGESSFPREVCERFGILDKETWLRLLEENGFYIDTVVESREEYEKYLSPKINLVQANGEAFSYPMMTILIKGRKNKQLIYK